MPQGRSQCIQGQVSALQGQIGSYKSQIQDYESEYRIATTAFQAFRINIKPPWPGAVLDSKANEYQQQASDWEDQFNKRTTEFEAQAEAQMYRDQAVGAQLRALRSGATAGGGNQTQEEEVLPAVARARSDTTTRPSRSRKTSRRKAAPFQQRGQSCRRSIQLIAGKQPRKVRPTKTLHQAPAARLLRVEVWLMSERNRFRGRGTTARQALADIHMPQLEPLEYSNADISAALGGRRVGRRAKDMIGAGIQAEQRSLLLQAELGMKPRSTKVSLMVIEINSVAIKVSFSDQSISKPATGD